MNLPPPLPGKPRKPPSANFVDVLGRISLVLGVLGAIYALLQVALFMALPDDFLQRTFQIGGQPLPPLPPALAWIVGHLQAMAWITLASSLLFLIVAWGVVKRSNAARLGFIAFMVVGTLGNLVSVVLLMQMVDWMERLGTGLGGADLGAQMHSSSFISMGTGVLSALLFVALHGWIVYKLCTPAVRAEFDR